MSAICIIPARGGSKRIPRKNIKEFCGKPIIAYSIEAALASELFDTVMVSTDDTEIAEIAQKYGAEVPFYRSPEMSSDTAMMVPVLLEVLNKYIESGKEFIHTCCLYPCAPFVTAHRLRQAFELLKSSGAGSVIPVVQFSYPPQRCFEIEDGKLHFKYPENYNVRSQDLTPLYHDVGQFCFYRTDCLYGNCFLDDMHPIILSDLECQDIDNEDDWVSAEVKLEILRRSRGG